MSSQTYYRERHGGFDSRERDRDRDPNNGEGGAGEKPGYEESLTKFKGGSWPWDLWTFFINIVGMKLCHPRVALIYTVFLLLWFVFQFVTFRFSCF